MSFRSGVVGSKLLNNNYCCRTGPHHQALEAQILMLMLGLATAALLQLAMCLPKHFQVRATGTGCVMADAA
jgi:hypothetical protein